jgi:hypothetical protein
MGAKTQWQHDFNFGLVIIDYWETCVSLYKSNNFTDKENETSLASEVR